MPSIRIAAAGACVSIVLFVSSIVAGSTMAQTATGEAPGKPLQLLKIVERSNPPSKPHPKVAAKPSDHTRLAARVRAKRRHMLAKADAPSVPAPTSEATASASSWPQADSSPSADVTAADAVPPPAALSMDQTPNRLVVGGQTVQVASPNDVNELDLAANDSAAKAGAAQTTNAASENGQATASPTQEIADADPKADLQKIETAQPTSTKVGSTSWILQVMAALGGAVTAGSLAWFLIGSTPQRTYG